MRAGRVVPFQLLGVRAAYLYAVGDAPVTPCFGQWSVFLPGVTVFARQLGRRLTF